MALKAFYEKQEDIPEALREHYAENGGRFVLALDGTLPDVESLSRTLGHEKGQRAAAIKERDALKTQLDEIRRDFEALKAAGPAGGSQADAGDKADWQRQIQTLKADYDAKLKQLEDRNKAADAKAAEAEDRLAQNEWIDGFRKAASSYVLDDALDVAIGAVKPLFKKNAEGKYVPMDGELPMPSPKNPTSPIEYGELVERTILNNPKLKFILKPSSGAGVNGNNGNGVPGSFVLTREQARDPATYRAASERAAKAGRELEITG